MAVVHLLGNGDSAPLFNDVTRRAKEKLLICNMPPFEVKDVYASIMVDFKMMKALTEGFVNLNAYRWVLGNRPKMWMEMRPDFYMKYAPNIREFYLTIPEYAENATNFNCGHMAAHYACTKLNATQLNLYGLDSIFDFNMRSTSDLVLASDRGDTNNYRLINIWRPIWTHIFNEFPDTNFVLYHSHGNVKIDLPKNVEIRCPSK